MTDITIKLTHTFLQKAHDLDALLKDCNKLSTFCSRLVKQSDKFPDRYNPLKYRGDGFELFVEALIKLSGADNRIGIFEYQNAATDEGGVDGFGRGCNGKPATVQCKFVSNSDTLLTANSGKDNLMGFAYLSQNKFGVDVNDSKNMLVITTAKGLHYYSDANMFLGKVQCLGYDELRILVDNNFSFWDQFRLLCS